MHPEKLWNRNFAAYFAATGFSSFGSTLTSVALGYLIYEKTGSTTGFAISLAISAATALLSPKAGALVDKYALKPMLVMGDVIRGLLLLALVIATLMGHFHVALVYAVNLINGLTGLVYRPAVGKLIPRMVPRDQMMRANGLMGSMYDTAGILGFLLGGTLVAFAGSTTTIIVDAVTFLLMGLVFLLINTGDKEAAAAARQNPTAKAEGSWPVFQYMVSSGMIICPLLIFLSSVYIAPFRITLPEQFSSAMFGTFFAVYSVGTLLAGLATAYFNERLFRRDILVAGVLAAPVVLLAAALTAHPVAYFAIALLLGFLNVTSSTIAYTSIQTLIRDDIRGRVFGIMGLIERGGMPLAYLTLSGMITLVSTTTIYTVFAGALLIVSLGLVAYLVRKNLLAQSSLTAVAAD
ncbi:MFS transporter [Deinococcus sp. HMF7604]|uniref:MFS transporter n=1 Tax=Deinococcus betulae TaxID=2873312 RepID=UPI001CCD7BFB|nr:MFS transporter [Deinococcus betulae]MBZ9752680.1 MFS transporter [Deinococcus betulae]